MSDILYDAAIKYKELKNIVYTIILGRKNYSYTIVLHFPPESFFHLTGMQHLNDLTFSSTNKERIYKDILNKKLTNEDLKKSTFYDRWHIDERISNLVLLKEMIESNSMYYLIHGNKYIQYTSIKADYLCEYNHIKNIVYLFLIHERKYPKFYGECKGCSFFIKHDHNYTIGTSKTTVLLIQKNDNGIIADIFRNPAYVE